MKSQAIHLGHALIIINSSLAAAKRHAPFPSFRAQHPPELARLYYPKAYASKLAAVNLIQ